MNQLHAKILRTHKKKSNIQSHHSSFSVNSVPIASSFINPVPIASTSEKTNDDDNRDEDSFSEADWDVIIDRWEELLIKKKFEEEQDNFDEVDIDFLSLEIHPAKNQAAK
ncbi:23079_t:CDS:1 [Gigaspora margarita]|uniref:23079_t:CDS:1 n=1 Tax=Gigaspora margarita TaxID=4874 RepID=A0ABN7UR78_GIGMA|nr:23079_t:CDS:1 [Gigaspora margarita]